MPASFLVGAGCCCVKKSSSDMSGLNESDIPCCATQLITQSLSRGSVFNVLDGSPRVCLHKLKQPSVICSRVWGGGGICICAATAAAFVMQEFIHAMFTNCLCSGVGNLSEATNLAQFVVQAATISCSVCPKYLNCGIYLNLKPPVANAIPAPTIPINKSGLMAAFVGDRGGVIPPGSSVIITVGIVTP